MEQKISQIIEQLFGQKVAVLVTKPDVKFGDYATNVALQLAGKLGQNPRQVAEKIAESLNKTGDYSEVSVAGPGFINIRLSAWALGNELQKIHKQMGEYGRSKKYDGKVVVTEYSDPNPFKVLHAGHLYTSIVGDAISNLIEASGGQVHRVNFGGDVGLHVAKTLWAAVKNLGGEYPEKLNDIPENERADWLAGRYVEGTAAYEDNEAAKKVITVINKQVYGFHSDNDHQSPLAQIYWTGRDWSYAYFDTFYDRIGTKFERYYPESETAPLGLKTVLEQKKKGVYEESDGAIVFKGEPYGLHTRVFVNREGLPTYEAKDVGLSIRKWDDYHFDESIIITGNDIIEYMKVVLKSIEQFKPELSRRTKHFTHGNVKLAGGVKMSSRKGNFLKAVDVIDYAVDANDKADRGRDEAPALAAIKWSFLKSRVGGDIIFDPEESVALTGNSGPYMQYSYARARSVLAQASNVSTQQALDFDEAERSLMVKLIEYPDVVHEATDNLAPHIICTYLYELAQEFSRFYEKSHVIGDEREAIRLSLVSAYSIIVSGGLRILGIETPERM